MEADQWEEEIFFFEKPLVLMCQLLFAACVCSNALTHTHVLTTQQPFGDPTHTPPARVVMVTEWGKLHA